MNVYEYQAKEILCKFGVPIPRGFVVSSVEEVEIGMDKLKSDVFVIKAQIHAGGRGKVGGVKFAKSPEEAKRFVESMLGMALVTHQTGSMGLQVKKVYLEEGLNIIKEYYLSLVIDPKLSTLVFIFSSEGGVDIEEVAKNFPTKLVRFVIDYSVGFVNFDSSKLGSIFNLSLRQVRRITDIAKSMYDAFIATDASQIEINPLAEISSGDFIAVDAKVSFDDNALYRHPEIMELYTSDKVEEMEAMKYGFSYIKMGGGNIGCMVNGAGLAMATMDIIKYYGAKPANFLDIGGSASKEVIINALRILLSDSDVKGILINIFGGIMRCDTIASSISEISREMNINVPLVVRLSGTNFEDGNKILKSSGLDVTLVEGFDDAAQVIVKLVNSLSCQF
ncbi:MAG: ADP-forming succinate--CoA ligase subunit beta [Wolbachia endosymbiont of Menacanthus eurysternus]|nr:MAG: ADP-forming succinate--CoA ligase subunit beta [Wolbachia endosymbiont of Menacanthus eurysternus]